MENKTVILTGCNRGIGEGIASVLFDAGYTIFGLNRTTNPDATSYKQVTCDIRDYQQLKTAVDQITSPISVVIANAGIRRFAPVDQMSLESWRDSVDTNLNAVFFLLRETLPSLRTNRGYFFVVGSHAEKYPFEGGAAYSSTKGALRPLVDSVIEDARYDGVRATYLSIGSVKNRDHGGDESWKLQPTDIGKVILGLLNLPSNMLIPYMDVRPQKPLHDQEKGIDKLQRI